MKTGFTCFHHLKSDIRWHVRKQLEIVGPKSDIPPVTLSFLSFFSFFLSFLFFSLSLFFFLLSSDLVFFLFCSPTGHSHVDPRQPKPRDHWCQSSITHQKAPPRAHSPHRYYRRHPQLSSNLAGVLKSASIATIQSGSSVVGAKNSSVESSFFIWKFFFFFFFFKFFFRGVS